MGKITPATVNSNAPQKVLKTLELEPVQKIDISISKEVCGKDLGNILSGVMAFTGAFSDGDRYMLDVKVSKLINADEDQVRENVTDNKCTN